MIQIKTVPVGGGVDLAREERIKKVDICIESLLNFSKTKGLEKALNRGDDVQEIAKQTDNHL